MSWMKSIFGGDVIDGVTAVGNTVGTIIDDIHTSEEEKQALVIAMTKLKQEPGKLQVELNKVEASHRSIFVAGWRPAIGWVGAMGLFCVFIGNPIAQWLGHTPVEMPLDTLMELVIAMLGLGVMRTVEKLKGASK